MYMYRHFQARTFIFTCDLLNGPSKICKLAILSDHFFSFIQSLVVNRRVENTLIVKFYLWDESSCIRLFDFSTWYHLQFLIIICVLSVVVKLK